MKAMRMLVACLLVAAAQQASAQIQFTDITAGSGVEYVGETYGAAWGDYNGDGRPDLFVSQHRSPDGLYLNLGDGTFENRRDTVDVWQQFPTRDQHGGTWADFDNDGDQDLIVALGSKAPTQFLVNNGVTLTDAITSFTFDPDPHWQGRTVTWFDYSGDGNLDFGIGTTKQAYHVHRQTVTQGVRDFLKQTGQVGLSQIKTDHYGQLADLTFDGRPELILQSESQNFPHRIFGIGTVPFTDLTSLLPGTPITNDSLFADFDGDLRQDALVVSGKVRLNGAEIVAPDRIEAQLIADNGADRVIGFQATGDITVVLHWSARSVSRTYIGANGLHPPLPPAGQPITFTLSPNDPNIVGIKPHTSSDPTGVYVGYTPATQTWQLINASGTVGSGAEGEWSYVYAYVSSTGTVSNLTVSNLTAGDMPRVPVLLANPTGNLWVNRTSAAGLNIPVSCVSAAAADFDNDMDTDIYLLCRNAVSNAQDILYENTGGGVFAAVSGAGGATGPVGFGVGTGDSVVTADFDVDGFVDLFQTNGLALFPIHPFSTGGPNKLYRNAGNSAGNSNHWIQLDFAGTTSNRDGIGAIVTVTAGGVAQRKERDGGIHRWSQNHPRLHFGLATNTMADIEVRWPSGALTTYPNVTADHIYRVSEDGSIVEVDVGEPALSPCGPPIYNKATEQALFIWKNCATDTWQVRMTSGGATWVVYKGDVQSDQTFTSVTGFSIEANDILNVSDPSRIVYSLGVGGTSEDGFDFEFPAGSTVCFNRTAPTNVPIYLGASRTEMSVPFDLETLGACN